MFALVNGADDGEALAERGRIRRIRFAFLCGAVALFALLYAPQAVLPPLAAEFAVTPGTVALLVSAGTFGLALAAVPLGTLSETVGRRRTMVVSLLTAEILGLVVPWVGSFAVMVGLRLLQGVAVAGLVAVAVAYLSEEAGGSRFGTTMGLYVAGTTVGGMAGRIVGGVVADLTGWRGGLLAVSALAGVGTVLFVALLPASRNAPAGHAGDGGASRWGRLLTGVRSVVADPVLYGPFLVAALGMGAFVTVYNVLTFRLIAPPLLVPHALAALAFLAYAAGTVSSALAGRAADRWGQVPVLLAGLAVMATGLAVMVAGALAVILTGLVVFTGGFFTAHAVASGWVGVAAPESARGQASATYQFCYYAGSSVGGVVGGWAYAGWGWFGMTVMLASWLVLAAVGVVLAGGIARRRSRAQAPTTRVARTS